MIKQYKRTSNSLANEKVHLINKIRQMENVIWDDMLQDTINGLDVVDIDNLIDRFEDTKKRYSIHIICKNLELSKDLSCQ